MTEKIIITIMDIFISSLFLNKYIADIILFFSMVTLDITISWTCRAEVNSKHLTNK